MSSFCNKEYCICNPELSLDQACPFEGSFNKVECPNNNPTDGVTTTTRLLMACVFRANEEYYSTSSCINNDNIDEYGISTVALVSNEDQSIQWSCGDNTNDLSCKEAPPCNDIMMSDSPTLAPSIMPTVEIPTSGSSSHGMHTTGTLLVWTLVVVIMMPFARKC